VALLSCIETEYLVLIFCNGTLNIQYTVFNVYLVPWLLPFYEDLLKMMKMVNWFSFVSKGQLGFGLSGFVLCKLTSGF